MPPNFEEDEGVYCFRVVRESVYPSRPFVTLFNSCHCLRTVHASVLNLHIGIPNGKIADRIFLVRIIYLSGVMPLASKTSKKCFSEGLESWSAERRG